MSNRRNFIKSLGLLLGGAVIAPKLMAEEPPKPSQGDVLWDLMNAPVRLGVSSSPYGDGAYDRFEERHYIAEFKPRRCYHFPVNDGKCSSIIYGTCDAYVDIGSPHVRFHPDDGETIESGLVGMFWFDDGTPAYKDILRYSKMWKRYPDMAKRLEGYQFGIK